MKRLVLIVVTLLVFCSLLVSCGAGYPAEGEYYCDENDMEIDFSLIAQGVRKAGRMYTDEGKAFYSYYVDIEGERITISDSTNAAYISGVFNFANDVFTVIEDGGDIELVFKKK